VPENRKTPTTRHKLPERRLAETRKICTPDGQTFYLSIGFDPTDASRPREIFYSAGFRSGSQLEFQVQDACVLISLLLQHGFRPADIGKSLARVETGTGEITHASITGLIVAELDRPVQ
jgi:hypothetical protein